MAYGGINKWTPPRKLGGSPRVKGRKGQHGVGLAIKEKIVEKAGENGITIECVSVRLLKARISIKSNFVTFVAAYVLIEEAPEGQKEGQNIWQLSTVP